MGADLLDRIRSALDWTSDPKRPGVSPQPATEPERTPPPKPEARPASELLGGTPSGLSANAGMRGQGFQGAAASASSSDLSYGRCGPGSSWGFLGDVYTPECTAHDAAVRNAQESGTSNPMSHIQALPLLPSAIGSYAREVTGADVHASVGGSVDLARGAAQGSIGLGGSSLNIGGARMVVPEAVQASGGVDLSRGAANAQLGGANGIGGRMNISEGQLEVNALGHTVDVAGGVRRGANAIGDAASNAWNALPSVRMPRLW